MQRCVRTLFVPSLQLDLVYKNTLQGLRGMRNTWLGETSPGTSLCASSCNSSVNTYQSARIVELLHIGEVRGPCQKNLHGGFARSLTQSSMLFIYFEGEYCILGLFRSTFYRLLQSDILTDTTYL